MHPAQVTLVITCSLERNRLQTRLARPHGK